ncbi:hypothetical protein HNQ88_004958 [Aureibacter tunicatorum]|uniref:Uncharacterized protein n=1 Tax=Aureibacter tunicatorum TaxID=866807 RepID=A0AAE4BUK9_9BACT|nr:hypothetical protein [Aureibacter tunicatorum]BDD07478.1 hypothetical protein AUTU_49610 [Aureibacter tunicatorum]
MLVRLFANNIFSKSILQLMVKVLIHYKNQNMILIYIARK